MLSSQVPLGLDGLAMTVRGGGVPRLAMASMPIHSHMLRHATGFKLANDGVDTRAIQDYLGHKSIANTVRYSRLSPSASRRFAGRTEKLCLTPMAN
jgi:integrase